MSIDSQVPGYPDPMLTQAMATIKKFGKNVPNNPFTESLSGTGPYALRKIRAAMARAFDNNAVDNTPWYKPKGYAANTYYAIGSTVVGLDGTNCYIAQASGTTATSGGGPTGTAGTLITDGTVKWLYYGPARGLNAYPGTDPVQTQDSATWTPNVTSFQLFKPSSTPAHKNLFTWNGGVVSVDASAGGLMNIFGSNYQTASNPAFGLTATGNVTFWTDSKTMYVRGVNVLYQGSSLAVEVNERRLMDGAFPCKANTTNPGAWFIDTSIAGDGWRKVTIRANGGGPYAFSWGIYIEPQARIMPYTSPFDVTMAVEGDSLLQGGNGTPYAYGLDAVSQFGTLLGIENVCNMAQGGTGFISDRSGAGTTYLQRLDRLVSLNADLYLIGGCHNDNGQTASAQLAAYITYLTTLRQKAPYATIVVGGNNLLGAEDGSSSSSQYNAESILMSAVDAIGDSNTYKMPILTAPQGGWMFAGNKSLYYNADGEHPQQRGVDYLARRYAMALRDVLGNG